MDPDLEALLKAWDAYEEQEEGETFDLIKRH
jgi:hypothetical protein